MSDKTGGPAFPVTETDHDVQMAPTELGMTLRDYFAAKAMQAMISQGHDAVGKIADNIACNAYWYADAMLKERDK